jgi:phage FluMu protein Com
MEFVVYIYARKSKPGELTSFRCARCGKFLFKHTAKRILISNSFGASYTELPEGSTYIEHKCHSCKSLYKIMFQQAQAL